MLAHSFLIESSSKLLVTNQDRHNSSNEFDFGVTCPWMTKILHCRTWISLRPVSQSLSNFMCSITGVGKGCIMFWGRLDQNSGVLGNRKPPLTYNGENGVSTFSRLLLIRPFLYTPPPHVNFVCGGVYCFHVVRPSIHPSVRPCCVRPWHFGFFPNILKTQWRIFINFCRHIDDNKVYLHKEK